MTADKSSITLEQPIAAPSDLRYRLKRRESGTEEEGKQMTEGKERTPCSGAEVRQEGKGMTFESNFVSICEAPAALKGISASRKARALALLSRLKPGFSAAFLMYEPNSDLDQAIEDLLAAGLIELGVDDGNVAVRLMLGGPSPKASAANEEGGK
jgi:hypothetical protein